MSAASLVACGPPRPPVLSHADTTAGLRIRINDKSDFLGTGEDEERDEESRKAYAAAQHAVVVRLQEAGYVVVEKGPYDLSAGTNFSIRRRRHEDPAFARARLRLKDRKGAVVEEITLEYRNNTAPTAEPDRVAISLINELNRSPKVAAIAQKRTTAPVTESAPTSTPDAGTTSL